VLVRLLISVTVLTVLFKVLLGLSWGETYVTIMLVGISVFLLRTLFDFGKAVGKTLSREQYNFNQEVHEHHTHERHPDPTRPREDYPAVIEIERQITRRVKP
jgi:hypothetical protein